MAKKKTTRKKTTSVKAPTKEVRQSQPADIVVRMPSDRGITLRVLSPSGNVVGTFRFTQTEITYLPSNAKKANAIPLSHLAAFCRMWGEDV